MSMDHDASSDEMDRPREIDMGTTGEPAPDSRHSQDVDSESSPQPCAYSPYDDGLAPIGYPRTGEDTTGIEAEVWEALAHVEDPEMPISVVDLGLIYDVVVLEDEPAGGDPETANGETETVAHVEMTLTYTGCPARDILTNDVRCAAETVAAVDVAVVHLRYTPEWTVDMVTEAGREALRDFGLSV